MVVADLDIVNPYFRTKDSIDDFKARGIELICSEYANTNVDIPALPANMYRLTADKDITAVIDVGGDDRGAYALGRYIPFIVKENNYRMIFVANCYRPLTRTAQDALEVMQEIEAACGLKFTDIVNNSHLGNFTDTQTLLDSQNFIKELSELSGLPVYLTTVRADLADAASQHIPNVFPLQLQEKYFDLPDQRL